MGNPFVSIIGHPTGRLIQKREQININLERIFEKAIERKIALEINASPNRLDLNGEKVKEAVYRGVKLSIGTDAHSETQLSFLELGTAMARRGWAEKKDVLNTLNMGELKKMLRR